MKKSAPVFLLCLIFGAAFSTDHPFDGAGRARKSLPLLLDRTANVLPNRIVIKRSSDGLAKFSRSWDQALARISVLGVEPAFPLHVNDRSHLSRIVDVRLAAGTDVFTACETLMQDASVEWAEPVYLRKPSYNPNDPSLTGQWYLAKVRATEAWNVSRQSTSVLIGIVDTGVWINHPDLKSGIWVNQAEIPGNGIDDDHNGFVDDVNGWDFGDNDNNPAPKKDGTIDLRWHGTEVAGVAGAVTDNGIGIASVGFNPKLMSVKSSQDGDKDQYIISAYKAIVYAADNGADIINCSFGSTSSSQAEREAVAHACSLGCLVVAAAGNGSSGEPEYPASLPNVLSATATGETDFLASFSSYGYTVDVSAPGMNMYTTTSESGYAFVDGTSFCSPLTVSLAALVKGLHPSWNGLQVGEQVRISSVDIGAVNPQFRDEMGRGRIDAYRALTLKSPSIRLDTTVLVEGPGANMDGVFDPGEELLLTFRLKNFLEGSTAITVVFSSPGTDVTLTNGTFLIPSLGTLQACENTGNPVRIKISKSAARGQAVMVSAVLQADGGYQDADYFHFDISDSYATIRGKYAALTVTAMGRLGLADINTEQGEGFVYREEGSLLFEGAVMAGFSVDTLSDVARGVDGSKQNKDFETTPGGEIKITRPGTLGDEQGMANFSDEAAVPSLHLGVNLSAFAFKDTLDGDYVLLAYRLYSMSTAPIRRLYFGLFTDWDVTGDQDAWRNLAGYDRDLMLGYVYERVSGVCGGLAVVSKGGAGAYKSIVNKNEIYPDAGGYTKREKWQHLSGGIQDVPGTEETDYSNVLGVGPLTVNPGDTVLVGFALAGGIGLNDLKSHVQEAKAKWQMLFEKTHAADVRGPIPSAFRLYDAFPNPFNAGTVIRYDLPERNRVVLTVHDVTGREVAHLVDSVQDPGPQETRWDGKSASGSSVPSGVYFCRIHAGEWTRVRKLSLVR